jgi:6-phosphogluconolactonase
MEFLKIGGPSNKYLKSSLVAVLASFISISLQGSVMAKEHTVYFTSNASAQSPAPESRGIYRSVLDDQTGRLSAPTLVAQASSPMFAALSPDGRYLYAGLSADGGQVGAWSIGADGTFTKLNQQPSGGATPCHVWVDATGKNLLVANYTGGNIACFPVKADGSLGEPTAIVEHTGSGPHPRRQTKPHPHSVYSDPTNSFVYSADLGADEVKIYRFDATKGTLVPNNPPSGKVPPGGGPRHFALHPRGFAYANNEMGLSVTVFKHDATTGALTEIQTVPALVEGTPTQGVTTAEIFVHPSGKWLYLSNRGHDAIVVYAIGDDGKLTWIEETLVPAVPGSFALSPDGNWLITCGSKDNKVALFKIEAASGKLQATEQTADIVAPSCVLFAPERTP